jgi:Domain of unknown function (DUF1844)
VSTLWTPGGEHQPDPRPAEGQTAGVRPGTADEVTEEEAREQLRQLREQLAATPVADIVANHAIGLWELAVLHLSPPEGETPDLQEAQLAIDAMGTLVEGLGDRLGRHEQPLRDALSQLRLAFVEMSRREDGGAGDGSGSE